MADSAERASTSSSSSADEPLTPDLPVDPFADARDATPRGSALPGTPTTPVPPAQTNAVGPISRVLGGLLRSMADAIAPDPVTFTANGAAPARAGTPTSVQTRRVARTATSSSGGISPSADGGNGGFSFGLPQLNLNLAGLQMFGGNGEGRTRVGSSGQDGIVLGSPIGLEDQQPDKSSNLRIEDGPST